MSAGRWAGLDASGEVHRPGGPLGVRMSARGGGQVARRLKPRAQDAAPTTPYRAKGEGHLGVPSVRGIRVGDEFGLGLVPTCEECEGLGAKVAGEVGSHLHVRGSPSLNHPGQGRSDD